jgi:dGTPase
MIKRLYEYYDTNPHMLPEDFQPQMSFEGLGRTVCDYIAGMTDKYAVDKFTEIFTPTSWRVRG